MTGETVLIVDDSPLMCAHLEEELQTLGVGNCHKALNGQEAVAIYREHRPDLVFLDINMPVLDGLQTLQVLRSFDSHCYVVMASGVTQADKVRSAVKLGAKGYMVKPYSSAKIAEVMRSYREERPRSG